MLWRIIWSSCNLSYVPPTAIHLMHWTCLYQCTLWFCQWHCEDRKIYLINFGVDQASKESRWGSLTFNSFWRRFYKFSDVSVFFILLKLFCLWIANLKVFPILDEFHHSIHPLSLSLRYIFSSFSLKLVWQFFFIFLIFFLFSFFEILTYK